MKQQSRLWRIVRWAPLAVMLLVAAALGAMLLLGGMTRVTAWYLLQIVPPVVGLIVLIAVVIYAIIRRRLSRGAILTGLVALLCISAAILMVAPQTYPASLERTQPAATVRLPANVPLKVVWGGDTKKVNQHVVVPDQRWAYDLLVEPYFSGSSELTAYGCYGVPVVAPAAGTVVRAHDGEPDMTPGVASNNYEAPEGNIVALRLETGTYLLLAHLKPGSVRVKVGDLVAEGQEIGQCGNSGNTSEPHIHIHHQRQDPNLYPINFAEGLPLYFRDHDGPPMPEGGVRVENGKPVALGPTVRHIGK
jgi:hypothetical protein